MRWIKKQFNKIMTSRRLTNDGPYVRRLEKEAASFLGVEHCVAVTNATIGLMIVARALDLEGSIIMPSMSFVATAHAFEWIGLRPVFVEINPDSHHISAEHLRRRITNQTAAIVGVHLWGNACDVDGLQELANEFGCKLIFDAAQAVGTEMREEGVAHFGDASVFSLHATKIINSGEGGIIATNDGDVAARCRLLRNFGFNGVDNVIGPGINGKMHEMTAVLALEAFHNYTRAKVESMSIYQRYKKELTTIPGVEVYEHPHGTNYHYNVIRVGGHNRDAVYEALREKDIYCRRYFYPGIHLTRPYNKGVHYGVLPITEKVLSEVLVLPSGGSLTLANVTHICGVLREEMERWQ